MARCPSTTFDGKRLPYAENLVNLIVADKLGGPTMKEVMRVLAPRGVAYIGGRKTVKPVPPEIDEWTHFLHGADGNAVAGDTVVGPPRRFQWRSGPPWARNHEIRRFFRAMVSGGGRVFYCVDEGQSGLIRQLPDRWTMVAQDAFNGLTLWKKSIPSIPKNEQIVVDGDRVYFAGVDGVTVLDAATGEELGKLEEALRPHRIVLTGRTLVCLRSKGLIAIDADSGKTLWESKARPGTQTLVAGSGVVASASGSGTLCLNLSNGQELWSTSRAAPPQVEGQDRKGRKTRKKRSNTKSIFIVHGDLLLESSGRKTTAYAARTGKVMWSVKSAGGRSMRSQDFFVARGCAWTAAGNGINGYDLKTGEVKKTIDPSSVQSHGHHLRCYQSKATERFLITQYRGAEFISLTDDQHFNNDWVRGACHYGVMPANGLLYTPPDECFCYGGAKLVGLNVLAPASNAALDALGRGPSANRLERGPAYRKPVGGKSGSTDDWPSYRHDARRTGATSSELPAQVQERWRVKLDGQLTQPVSAGGIVYVAVKDRHMLHAFTADSGEEEWRFTTGGYIDSSPTVYEGKVLLGCSDGWVYCLRASDGVLAWRFRAAPEARLVMDHGRLESAWRVHGSVIVEDGVLYCTAGRSSFLDGGIFLYGLEPATGEVVHRARLDTRMATREDAVDQKFSTAFHIEGARSDILVAEGGHIFLNQIKFTRDLEEVDTPYAAHGPEEKTAGLDVSGVDYVAPNPYLDRGFDKAAALGVSRGHLGDRNVGLHMFTTGGFLEDSWFNRTFWMYARTWPGFQIGHIAPKTGQLLVVGDRLTYAVQAYPTRNNHSPMFKIGSKGYLLTADRNDNEPMLDHRSWSRDKGMGFTRGAPPQWHQWVPIRMRSMVLAGGHLFVAGPPDVLESEDPMAPFEGRRGMVLRALDASSGKSLAEYKMDGDPVFDGMSASGGKLLISLRSGEVVCFGGR